MMTLTSLKNRPLVRWSGTAALALTLSLTHLTKAEAASFSFTQIADESTLIPGSTETFTAFFGVSLNNSGDVAFRGFGGFGSTSNQGIYVGDGDGLTTIADESTPVPGGTGTSFENLLTPSINDSGDVAFRGFDSAFNQGVYVGDGGGLTTIADESTPIPGGNGTFENLFSPSINDSGDVAFTGLDSALNEGIYVGDGGGLTTIADENTPVPGGTDTFNDVFSPSINDSSDVVFGGRDSGFNDGIYVGDGGGLTTIADESTPVPDSTDTFDGFFSSSINDSGDVAFRGFSPSQSGIYTTLAGSLAKVVAVGDLVLGKEVAFFSDTSELNNDQSIAFVANFTDGSEGVFRADLVHDDQPTSVPEPATAVGLLAFGAGAAWRRKQRQGMA